MTKCELTILSLVEERGRILGFDIVKELQEKYKRSTVENKARLLASTGFIGRTRCSSGVVYLKRSASAESTKESNAVTIRASILDVLEKKKSLTKAAISARIERAAAKSVSAELSRLVSEGIVGKAPGNGRAVVYSIINKDLKPENQTTAYDLLTKAW